MNLSGLQKLSLIDFPGKTSAIIFTQGCMFKCKFCHNAELVDINQKGAYEESNIIEFLQKRKGLLQAVTITGGEPCIHKDLPEFIQRIKKMGYLVKLDTTGYFPSMVRKLLDLQLLDYVAMDVKLPLEKYQQITQTTVYAQRLRESIQIIRESDIEYEFRTTLPRILIHPEDILKIGKEIAGAKRYVLQHFNGEKTLDASLHATPSFSQEEIDALKKQLQLYCEEVLVR